MPEKKSIEIMSEKESVSLLKFLNFLADEEESLHIKVVENLANNLKEILCLKK